MVGAYHKGLVGLLLVGVAAAIEMFDELPAPEDEIYQNDNDINTELLPQKQLFLLYKILKALQTEQRNNPELSSNRIFKEDNARQAHRESINRMMMKRYPGFLSSSAKMRFIPYNEKAEKKTTRAQLCYFKLCALSTTS